MTSTGPRYDYLSALFFNCTLKPSPQLSHTQGLIDRSAAIMARQGVRTETVRAADHDIATGVWPDMTEHGAATDAWPRLYQQVLAADILVIAGPIWLGDNSSVTKRVIERLYACSHLLNDAGQYAYYGRVAGCLAALVDDQPGLVHARPRPSQTDRFGLPILPTFAPGGAAPFSQARMRARGIDSDPHPRRVHLPARLRKQAIPGWRRIHRTRQSHRPLPSQDRPVHPRVNSPPGPGIPLKAVPDDRLG